jgi:hypothetical protein
MWKCGTDLFSEVGKFQEAGYAKEFDIKATKSEIVAMLKSSEK